MFIYLFGKTPTLMEKSGKEIFTQFIFVISKFIFLTWELNVPI